MENVILHYKDPIEKIVGFWNFNESLMEKFE